jgi:hypothetical protein
MDKRYKQFCKYGHDTFVTGRYRDHKCIACVYEYDRTHKEIEKQRKHQYYLDNKETILTRNEIYKNTHKEIIKIQQKPYRDQFYLENKKTINEQKRIRFNARMIVDINFKLKVLLRNRLRQALKSNQKNGSAVRDLGCSIDFLKQYIQSKFYSNMSWSNWGKVWELDHIKPLFMFDLTVKENQLKVCHYTNLQPLTIEEHQKKTIDDLKKIY